MRRLLVPALAAAGAAALIAAPSNAATTVAIDGFSDNYEEYVQDVPMPAGSYPSANGLLCTGASTDCDTYVLFVNALQGVIGVNPPALSPLLNEVPPFDTPVPSMCVGVNTTGPVGTDKISDPTEMHIAAYQGLGIGEPIAVSYDGTLVFTALQGTQYTVKIATSPTSDTDQVNDEYDVRFAAQDINHGLDYILEAPFDVHLCGPGGWAADVPLSAVFEKE